MKSKIRVIYVYMVMYVYMCIYAHASIIKQYKNSNNIKSLGRIPIDFGATGAEAMLQLQ